MVSRSDVLAAYRIFLDRDPEDEEVVQGYMSMTSTEELFRAFLESEECRERLQPVGKPLDWPPMEIQLRTSDEDLQAMMDRVNRHWTQLGIDDPYWSVLGSEDFRQETIEETREEFYETGQMEVDRLFSFAARSGIDLAARRTCFELGCGIARVTRALAPHFQHVYAADISAVHLEHARTALAEADITNVSLIRVTSLESIRSIRNYDLFYSYISLQHNAPPVIAHILGTVLTNLNPGGVAFFQVPTYHLGYEFSAQTYLENEEDEASMEMHVLPQEKVMDIIYGTGCKVLEVREDPGNNDPEGVSNAFFVQKRATPGLG
ncbi:MAG: class I SAM-dependent methyltransferase [Acidisphaera sp.]|nr:class I SAM-dependent methyltransferase [Acidisphaera sp.]